MPGAAKRALRELSHLILVTPSEKRNIILNYIHETMKHREAKLVSGSI